MRTTILYLFIFAFSIHLYGQNFTTSIKVENTDRIHNAVPFLNGGCAILEGYSPLNLHIVTSHYQKTLKVKIAEDCAMSFLTSGLQSQFLYVSAASLEKAYEGKGSIHEVFRVDSIGNKTSLGKIKGTGNDQYYRAGSYVTAKKYYIIYSDVRPVLMEDGKSFATHFIIYWASHKDNKMQTQNLYIPTNSSDKWATFAGCRGEELYFNFVTGKTQMQNTVWSFNPEDGLEKLFTVDVGIFSELSPQKILRESFGGLYRDYTNWNSDVVPYNPYSGALAQVVPDPFGQGFYMITVQQEGKIKAFIAASPCNSYLIDYYTESGKKKWSKTQTLPNEISKEATFKRANRDRANRIMEVIPLDSNTLRIIFGGYYIAFPVLFKSKKGGESLCYKFSSMAYASYDIYRFERFYTLFVAPEEDLNGYKSKLDELFIKNKPSRNEELIGINGLDYQHILMFNHKKGLFILSAWETGFNKKTISSE